MSKVLAVIRSIGEATEASCIEKIQSIFGEDFYILKDYKPLEKASKSTIQLGEINSTKYEWILAVDADVILNRDLKWIEDYCDEMKQRYNDNLFSFTGYLDCTKRGLIDGLHFFRTGYCKYVLNGIKNVSFQYKPGREESEICWFVRDKFNLNTVQGYLKESFGQHIWLKL